jgi:hypothetical protein
MPLIPSLLSHLQPTGSHTPALESGGEAVATCRDGAAPTCSPEERSWGGEAAATCRDGATPTCSPEERSWGGALAGREEMGRRARRRRQAGATSSPEERSWVGAVLLPSGKEDEEEGIVWSVLR